ncbi:MFS transporter [Deltaproteobacteria bacterium Smac51]|nr:MFS transporter [Deltaproteobacteria bacterium Smac51]
MFRENRWCILAIVSCALFLISVDMTVLYTALPRLTHDLGASAAQKLWIINAYTLVVAGLLPGFGTLGDRLGHKKMLMAGLIVFGLASSLAAFAPNPQRLIMARVVLGLGAAMMMPATLSIIRLTFSDIRERTLALGIWSAMASGGGALGPVIGGFLLEYFWWGSVFLINVPIVLAALISCGLILAPSRPNAEQSWSLSSSLLITVGLVGLTYAIKEISKPEASYAAAAASLIVGAAALTCFVRVQRRTPIPLIDFSLFKDRIFFNGVIVALLASVAMVGVELAISQRLQLVLGLSPLQAGLTILPIPLAAFIGGPVAGWLLPRIGLGRLLNGTLSLTILGLVAILMSRHSGGLVQAAGMAALGFGIGACMAAASSAIMSRASVNRAGMAASIEEVSYELGGVMGITVFGSILTAVYSATLVLPQELSSLRAVYDSLDAAVLASERLAPDAAGTLIYLARESFDKAFMAVLILAAVMFGGMLAAVRPKAKMPDLLIS